MSGTTGLVLAEKDPATVLSEALAIYKTETGVTLAPADPRRLHLQALLLLLAQMRALIDFSGKQSLLRYVSSLYIEALADLWDESLLPAKLSQCTLRFAFPAPGVHVVPAGVRGTDGTHLWAVVATTTSGGGATHVDALARCTDTSAGSTTNGVAIGQIATLVDPDLVPGCSGVENTTATISGRNIETTEAFRERLRSVPESRSTCGPRNAYEAEVLEASSSVADVAALGPDDAADMAGTAPNPGEVHIIIIEGERDAEGKVVSTIPAPSGGLIATVGDALSAEDVRPLTDLVIVKAPQWSDFDIDVAYYISRSRSASAVDIQAAVEAAFDGYKLWQSKIGRDINPSELIARLVVAGAKRAVVTSPAFTPLDRDECSRLGYETLTYSGVEDD